MTTDLADRSEAAFIAQCKQGNKDAISELFERHYPAAMVVARGILRDREDAQDAVQAAFMVAFRRLESFRGDSSFKTWITRIVVNCCLLQLRERRNRKTRLEADGHNGEPRPEVFESRTPTPEKSAWCGEIATAWFAAVARLPKNLRDPYTLFTISEVPLEDVASTLGLTVSATKTRLFRARAGLRSSLEGVWSGRHGHLKHQRQTV